MSSGWGCQHLTKFKEEKEWCRLLKHKCEPGCKGCVLSSAGVFSQDNNQFNSTNENRKVKNRSDSPLDGR